jgi:hypothetical protein
MKLSKLISFVFHPILMPTYALLLLFQCIPLFSQVMDIEQKNQILKLTCIFTFFLPILSVFILKKLRVVSSYYMENQEERRWPLLFALGWYYLFFLFLETLHIHFVVVNLLVGAMLILVISAIVSNFWKISLHMLGIGGVLGAFLAIHSLFGGNIYLIIALIFCAGCVGFARINENAHNLKQVYLGFLLGVFIEFFIFYF